MSGHLPSLRSMLEALTATLSVSSLVPENDHGNRPMVDLLAEWLEPLGFRIEILSIPNHAHKFNLVATLGDGEDGLALCGHTDTVPFDAAHWTHEPLRLSEENGHYYGLGIADMKAFFALAIEAARTFRGRTFQRPLVLLATADEESTMQGARTLAESGIRIARHAVIGEPTGLKPVRLHKGVMGESVRLVGRSGHASDPGYGINAMEGMHEVIGSLLQWREELRHTRNDAFRIPNPTMNLGHIHGGDNANRICGECELHIDVRMLPGLTDAQLRGQIRSRVAEIASRRGLQWSVEPLFTAIPPSETPAQSPLVRACEHLTGQPAGAVDFGTEAPFFNQLGMDTVILGPGDISQAHQPDESLPLARIDPMLDILRGLITEFCLAPADQ